MSKKLLIGAICADHPDHLGRTTKDGYCVRCKSVQRMNWRAKNIERETEKRAANRVRENELARSRHAENPEAARARVKKHRDAHPEAVKASNYKSYHANVEANKARSAEWAKANPERVAHKNAEWRKANPEKIKAQNEKQYAKADKQKRYEASRAWQDANRDKVRASVRKWNQSNPDKRVVHMHKRRSARQVCTPSWANTFFMQEAYHLARLRTKRFGFQWHVDHIVPLQSPLVCGLHTEQNMRVIPGKDNSAKGNRYWPDMPEMAGA